MPPHRPGHRRMSDSRWRTHCTDDALNSVSCYLPLFECKALTSIKDELEGRAGERRVEVGLTSCVPESIRAESQSLRRRVRVHRDLPSIPTPDVSANPVRRAKHLVRLLADDAVQCAMADANALLTKTLKRKLNRSPRPNTPRSGPQRHRHQDRCCSPRQR